MAPRTRRSSQRRIVAAVPVVCAAGGATTRSSDAGASNCAMKDVVPSWLSSRPAFVPDFTGVQRRCSTARSYPAASVILKGGDVLACGKAVLPMYPPESYARCTPTSSGKPVPGWGDINLVVFPWFFRRRSSNFQLVMLLWTRDWARACPASAVLGYTMESAVRCYTTSLPISAWASGLSPRSLVD